MPYFNVYEAFNSMDLNSSGSISREEFRRMIQSRGFYVSEKEVEEIVDKMDKNKDGRVSFAEVSKTSCAYSSDFVMIEIYSVIPVLA